jgi:uncharacterized membrane protein YhaH (DUF805 family)
MDTVKTRYAAFSGTATRNEFWSFFGAFFVVYIVLYILLLVTMRTPLAMIFGLLLMVWALGLLVPYYAVMFRRLHDTGKSGWWFLISFIPFGVFVLIYFLVKPTLIGPNKYAGGPPSANVFS